LRSAALHIASNDADENPFDIALTGTSPVRAVTGLTGGSFLRFNNESFTVGYEFTVSQAITVESLGFLDEGSDGLVTAHDVGIFDLCGTLRASGTVVSGTGANSISSPFTRAVASAVPQDQPAGRRILHAHGAVENRHPRQRLAAIQIPAFSLPE
jgi:hypothetical protein